MLRVLTYVYEGKYLHEIIFYRSRKYYIFYQLGENKENCMDEELNYELNNLNSNTLYRIYNPI